MEVWKIMFLSKWVICRFHVKYVNLPGCNPSPTQSNSPPSPPTSLMLAVWPSLWASSYRWLLFRNGNSPFTRNFRYLKMEVLNLVSGDFGDGFSLTKALHTAYIGEYLHFRYLKCLVNQVFIFQGVRPRYFRSSKNGGDSKKYHPYRSSKISVCPTGFDNFTVVNVMLESKLLSSQ